VFAASLEVAAVVRERLRKVGREIAPSSSLSTISVARNSAKSLVAWSVTELVAQLSNRINSKVILDMHDYCNALLGEFNDHLHAAPSRIKDPQLVILLELGEVRSSRARREILTSTPS